MGQNTDYWKNKSAFEIFGCHKLSITQCGDEMYYQNHLIDLLLLLQSVLSTLFFFQSITTCAQNYKKPFECNIYQ